MFAVGVGVSDVGLSAVTVWAVARTVGCRTVWYVGVLVVGLYAVGQSAVRRTVGCRTVFCW